MNSFASGDVSVNGLRLHYYRTRQTPSHEWPALVMLHGITDSGQCWPRVVKALAGEYAMVLPDARGHGLSDKPATGYSPADHATDVAGLIRALGLEQPVLIGHSMGGAVAATTAAHCPELVSGVILEDPPWFPPLAATAAEHAQRRASWNQRILDRKAMTYDELVVSGRAEWPAWDDEEFPGWAAAKLAVSPDVTTYESTALDTWRDAARAIECPALLITSDVAKGGLVTPEMAAEAQRLNPGIQVVHVPSAGHNIRRESFAAYLAAVRAFLAALKR